MKLYLFFFFDSLILLQILWAVCASIAGLMIKIFVTYVPTEVFKDHNNSNGSSYNDDDDDDG